MKGRLALVRTAVVLTLAFALVTPSVAAAGARSSIIAGFAAKAGKPLSAARGKAFFTGKHTGGKPETPTCLTCHTSNLRGMGKTRAGKAIKPMAVSANPERFTDPKKVAKWFRRNCKTVLGRECTAQEKGDVLTWLATQ